MIQVTVLKEFPPKVVKQIKKDTYTVGKDSEIYEKTLKDNFKYKAYNITSLRSLV